jgi:predicted RND superfamily exporter protein
VAAVLSRSLAAVVVVISGPALGVLWTVGLLAAVGEPLNLVNSVIFPLVLVIGLTDSVHLMFHVRRQRSLGSPRVAAVAAAIRHVGAACVLTSLTTAIAFASLATADLLVIRRFGLSCSAGVVLTFVAVITVNPLLSTTRLGDRLAAPKHRGKPFGDAPWLDGITAWVVRHRWAVTVAGAVATLALLLVSSKLQPNVRIAQLLPATGEARKALDRCDVLFGGTLPVAAVVEWPPGQQLGSAEVLQTVAEVHEVLAAEPLLASPISLQSVLQTLPGTGRDPASRFSELRYVPEEKLKRIVRTDQRRTMVLSRIRDVGTRISQPIFLSLENGLAEVQRRHPGFRISLSGWVVEASSLGNAMVRNLVISLFMAVGITFAILSIVFRSLRIGLVSLLPNLFPLSLTAAVMVLVGLPLHFTTATVFSVCFGIAVDDTLHFLTRYRQEISEGAGGREAIALSVRRIGRVLISTTVVVLTGMLVLFASDIASIRQFGLVFAVGMISALLADLVLLPAILACFPDRPAARS